MEWPMFSEHIVHNVEKWRYEKLDAEKQNKKKAENEIMMITTAQAQTQNQIQSSSGTAQITPVTPSVAPLTPIHMHVNPTGGNYCTVQGRGKPLQRGSMPL